MEDLWGAGAVISALGRADGSLSPEAEAARAAYDVVRDRELEALLRCASGRELVEGEYSDDVGIAAEVGTSASVPLLVGQRFVDAADGTARQR